MASLLALLVVMVGSAPRAVAGDVEPPSGPAPFACSAGTPTLAVEMPGCLAGQPPALAEHNTTTESRAGSAPVDWIHTGACRRLGETQFCAFTKPAFHGGDGVALITSPERFEEVTHLFASDDALHDTPSHASFAGARPYVEVELPGKGIGLVATQPIRTGQRVMARTPAVMVDGRALAGLAPSELANLLVPAIEPLPPHHQAQFLNLSSHDGAANYTDKVHKIYSTNAYKTWIKTDVDFHSTFVELSRMNHECKPNCGYYFDPATMTQRVYAVRDIMPGEELTVAYIDPIQSRAERQARLQKDWGFQCSCQRCAAEEHFGAESDERVEQIKALWKELDDYSKSSSASVGKAELLVTLFQLEGLEGRIHEVYYRAALEYNGVGDAGMAMKYARLCIDRGMLIRGRKQPFITNMREIIADPSKHWSWRFRLQEAKTS